MKTRSTFVCALVVLLAVALAIPPDVATQGASSAGRVSRVIPAVSIQRGTGQLAAAAQAPVFWEDVVSTERMGRARVALDDGSILNVGSEASLRITRHDPAAQKTELQFSYGRMRAKVVRLARPGASFEVRTPVATAGVVGTDFFLAFENYITLLIVFEGLVRFCNLAGQCVSVGAGMMSAIRGDQQPDPPSQASQAQVLDAARSTEVQEEEVPRPRGHSKVLIVGLILAVALPAVLVPSLTKGSPRPSTPCQPQLQVSCVGKPCP